MLSRILKKYFVETGMTVRAFASISGLTETSIRLFLRDKHKIHKDTAERIVKASQNKITIEMLEPYLFKKDW